LVQGCLCKFNSVYKKGVLNSVGEIISPLLISRASVKVLLLTFMRVGALVPGEWSEADWDQRIWTIPARRMKGRDSTRQEHIIPFSQPLIDILDFLKPITGHSPYIF